MRPDVKARFSGKSIRQRKQWHRAGEIAVFRQEGWGSPSLWGSSVLSKQPKAASNTVPSESGTESLLASRADRAWGHSGRGHDPASRSCGGFCKLTDSIARLRQARERTEGRWLAGSAHMKKGSLCAAITLVPKASTDLGTTGTHQDWTQTLLARDELDGWSGLRP